jgi:hypothetical protein
MKLAEDIQDHQLHIVLDYLTVIQVINGVPSLGEHSMIRKEIVVQKSKFSRVVFSHERREANKEAHNLACLTTTLYYGRNIWFSNPPSDLNILVNIMINNQ